MAYNINSGNIEPGVLYLVAGDTGTITYDSTGYSPGSAFRGVAGISTFSGSGDALVTEVTELQGGGTIFGLDAADLPVFAESVELRGMAVEFELNPAERKVNEVTRILGFSLELIDYPFYSFEITETRL